MCAVIRMLLAHAPAREAYQRRRRRRNVSHSRALACNAAPLGSISTATARARAPAALHAVTTSAGPVGGRVGTRPRPDSAYVRSRRHAPSAPVTERRRRRDAPRRIGTYRTHRLPAFRSRLLQIPDRLADVFETAAVCANLNVDDNFVSVQSKLEFGFGLNNEDTGFR